MTYDDVELSREMVDQSRDDWNMTCLAAGIPAITLDTCARLMAVLYVHGNNEYMTHCPALLADLRYIQKRFRIHGTGRPDPEFAETLKYYIAELEEYEDANKGESSGAGLFSRHIPQWAIKLFNDRYGIKLIN